MVQSYDAKAGGRGEAGKGAPLSTNLEDVLVIQRGKRKRSLRITWGVHLSENKETEGGGCRLKSKGRCTIHQSYSSKRKEESCCMRPKFVRRVKGGKEPKPRTEKGQEKRGRAACEPQKEEK